jgi:hypothetical protein
MGPGYSDAETTMTAGREAPGAPHSMAMRGILVSLSMRNVLWVPREASTVRWALASEMQQAVLPDPSRGQNSLPIDNSPAVVVQSGA